MGQNGPKLTAAEPGDNRRNEMPFLVKFLEYRTGKPVIDKTGLTGAYQFDLLTGQGPITLSVGDPQATISLIGTLSEKFGLDLIPATTPVSTLVIEHADKITGQ